MPTYQYACTQCGHAFDQFQSFSDDALSVCPQCSGKLRKIYNAVGVVFKGSGFYRNDSRSTNGSEGGSSDSGSDSGSGSETKTETKTKPEKAPSESKSESKSESTPASTPAAKPSSD